MSDPQQRSDIKTTTFSNILLEIHVIGRVNLTQI